METTTTQQTRFSNENIRKDGAYLLYVPAGSTTWADFQFIARFKHHGPHSGYTVNQFKKFLIANFTVEEYMNGLEAGETPIGLLDSKGFDSIGRLRRKLEKKGITPNF